MAQCSDESAKDTVTTTIFTCVPYTWTANGMTYSSSTSQVMTNSADECLTEILNLTYFENRIETKRIFACSPYFWSKSGETYSESGMYTVSGSTENGCTVEHQLHLTVSSEYNSSVGGADCDFYQWHELELPIGAGQASSVSIDASGTRVALGDFSAGTGGEVNIYDWTISGWIKQGTTLTAETEQDNFGQAISLSKNGKHLAVGAPYALDSDRNQGYVKIYQWTGSNWDQVGNTLFGQTIYDEFGYAVDFNSDGSIVAIGAPSSNRVAFELGEVRMYHWTGTDWTQMGESLYEKSFENIPDNNGASVSLSGDGLTVMFGAPYAQHPTNLAYAGGKYQIYDWEDQSWQQRFSVSGYRTQMQMGKSVCLNEDGDRYVVGADTDRNKAGIAFITGGDGSIPSFTDGDRLGFSVSMNQQGNIAAISSYQNSDILNRAGKVEVFKLDQNGWNQIGQDLYGEIEDEFFGNTVALNGDGNVIVVGSYKSASLSGDPIVGTHVYYYGCANAAMNCTESTCTELIEATVDVTQCYSYNFGGNYYSNSGQYQTLFQTQAGCDSLVTLNLNVINKTNHLQDVTVCDSYEFNGETFTESGEYSAVFMSSAGCDSLVTLSLIVEGVQSYAHDLQACGSYTFDGNTLSTSGTYDGSFLSQAGCDSLVTINLEIVESFDLTKDITACDSFEFGESILLESGTYDELFETMKGCDSLVHLNLTIATSEEVNTSVEACSFQFDGFELTESGIYTATFPNQHGCDSLVTLDLTISPESVCFPLGIQDNLIPFYPNPTKDGFIFFDLNEDTKARFRLINSAGKLIQSGTLHNQLFIEGVDGLFILEIIQGDRKSRARILKGSN